jgi:hypothetical protein
MELQSDKLLETDIGNYLGLLGLEPGILRHVLLYMKGFIKPEVELDWYKSEELWI